MSDHALAARLATEAGKLLLGVREEFADAEASERKAAGDKRSHDFLIEALAGERPRGCRPVRGRCRRPGTAAIGAGVDR